MVNIPQRPGPEAEVEKSGPNMLYCCPTVEIVDVGQGMDWDGHTSNTIAIEDQAQKIGVLFSPSSPLTLLLILQMV